MTNLKRGVMAAVLAAAAGVCMGAGGVLPDGQGTNWSYGDIYGQGTYYLRNLMTAGVDGGGITNINAANVAAGSVASAFDGGAITNLTGGNIVGNIAYEAITNALDNYTPAIGDEVLKTNDTPQAKAGLLTLNGGAAIGGTVTLTPSATQTLATDANVEANASLVAVVGDGGAVTCGMSDGTTAGQLLTIRGTHADNTVTLTNSAVLPQFRLGLNDLIGFIWTGTEWAEQWRRDN